MATRLYPTQATPDFIIHGPYRGNFGTFGLAGAGFSPVQDSYRLRTSKADGGQLFTRFFACNQQANYDGIVMRWFTDRLDAQSISGTFQLCTQCSQDWENGGGSNMSVVHLKTHVYITVGDSCTVRSTLLNNFVETVNVVPFILGTSSTTGISLTGPPAITTQSASAGDRICVELYFRIVSSPTPAPTYPPTAFTEIAWRGLGTTDAANVAFADLVAGDTVNTRAPWFEFSANLTFQALPAPPANDACVDAVDFTATIPFAVSDLVTIESTDVERSVWYKFTAPTTGKFCVLLHGTNYHAEADAWTGTCGALTPFLSERKSVSTSRGRSQTSLMFDAVSGTQYHIQIANKTVSGSAIRSGGIFGMKAFYRDTTPEHGDLYLPSVNIVAYRDGEPINFSSSFAGLPLTGVAIDYSRTPMDDLNGGVNTNDRLLVGLHSFDIVEVLNLPDLSYGEGQFEVDFISDPFVIPDSNVGQLHTTDAGLLYVAWFGNGYLYVSGVGSLPAFLNTVSNNAAFVMLRSIDAWKGDNQTGAPFADVEQSPTSQITAPWAIDINGNICYYTSGGIYVPVGGNEVRRFNVSTGLQEGVFVTPALLGTDNPGLKGLSALVDGTILLCNGTVVQKYNSSGVLTGTFTPSIPLDSITLVDVALDPDDIHAWVLDLWSTRMYKIRISDMTEISNFQTYLTSGTLLQMVVYASPTVANPLSGIYVLEPGKRNDTVYTSLDPITTEDRKIPDPKYRTAYLGE